MPRREAERGEGRLSVTVPPEAAGMRLDRLLAQALPGLSRTRLKRLIESGLVADEEGTITEPSRRVKPGRTVIVRVPESEPARPRAQAIPLAILYEDEHLIVVDKPVGMAVHPAPGTAEGTLVNALLAHCGDTLSGIGGVRRPGIVHRLDKDTAGVMVVAKTDAAHAGLARQFAERTVERAYHALVWGVPVPSAGEIAGNIGRSPTNRKKMAVRAEGGKPALTRYRVLRRFGDTASLIECRLKTGRTHQIRVHLADKGHPVVGDPLYGRRRPIRLRTLPAEVRSALEGARTQALHAYFIGFCHPGTGKWMMFRSDSPSLFKMLLDKLEKFDKMWKTNRPTKV
ncbi:MAG: RluA family pseudouridine synthase [Proteobacteria bacterium]|nr:RluA family pseudouridine synthase [Pseudomonadota bacterium]